MRISGSPVGGSAADHALQFVGQGIALVMSCSTRPDAPRCKRGGQAVGGTRTEGLSLHPTGPLAGYTLSAASLRDAPAGRAMDQSRHVRG